MKGLYGKTHFELSEYIDLKPFDKIQLDILKGISTAWTLANHGFLISTPIYEDHELSSELSYKPLMTAYQEYLKLPENDPIKIEGSFIETQHGYNQLAVFLKYVYGAHDSCSFFPLWDHYAGWRSNVNHRKLTPIAKHFDSLISWIDNLRTQERVFSNIGRAYIIAIDSNGYSFEHKDPPLDPDVDEVTPPEFIHIRPNLNRPFYVYDGETKTKHYINSRIGWWNDRDIHGGEVVLEPSYAIRIDGVFTDEFREKIIK